MNIQREGQTQSVVSCQQFWPFFFFFTFGHILRWTGRCLCQSLGSLGSHWLPSLQVWQKGRCWNPDWHLENTHSSNNSIKQVEEALKMYLFNILTLAFTLTFNFNIKDLLTFCIINRAVRTGPVPPLSWPLTCTHIFLQHTRPEEKIKSYSKSSTF